MKEEKRTRLKPPPTLFLAPLIGISQTLNRGGISKALILQAPSFERSGPFTADQVK